MALIGTFRKGFKLTVKGLGLTLGLFAFIPVAILGSFSGVFKEPDEGKEIWEDDYFSENRYNKTDTAESVKDGSETDEIPLRVPDAEYETPVVGH